MAATLASDTTLLNATNIALGVACLAILVAVAVAAWLDARERRRWRAMVPPCWPPPGVTEAEAAPEGSSRGEEPKAGVQGRVRS